jgi:pimeloyl-ACP methyl ester carboxylesterase
MPITDDFKDVLVVIPGILGSRLIRREGTREITAWDFSIKSLPRLLKEVATGGLVLGEQDAPPNDGIEAVDLFHYQLLPGFFGVDDYRPLVEWLQNAVADSRQLITFPYDWRTSNRFAAERLKTRALDALRTWKDSSGCSDAKLWLICHSMGGLVARYFCEHLDGAKDTRAIVTFGTPHRGAVKALDAIVNGKSIGPLSLTRLVRSMPSVYELMPLYPVVRLPLKSKLVMRRVADFFGLDPETGQDTAEFLQSGKVNGLEPLEGIDRGMLKRALEFHARIRLPAEARSNKREPSPYRQQAFFNRRQLTALSSVLNGKQLDILDTYPYERDRVIQDVNERGDGTVPSFSSVPIEWSDTNDALTLADKHAAMQSATTARDSILNWLRPIDVRQMKGSSVNDASVVELTVPPALNVGEDLVIRAATLRPMNVNVRLEHVETGATKTQPTNLTGDNVHRDVVFRRPPGGVHRVSAVPTDGLLPTVSDYVLVVDF